MTTEAKLGEYLLKGNADMAMEEQAAKSNYEGIGKDYIKKLVTNQLSEEKIVMKSSFLG